MKIENFENYELSEHTYHAPSARYLKDEVSKQIEHLNKSHVNPELFNHIPILMLVLNDRRQIIFANNEVIKLLELNVLGSLAGYRPGEIFGCINANLESGGCGTSKRCKVCGIVNSVLECQQSNNVVQKEVRLTSFAQQLEASHDFKVTTRGIKVDEENFLIVSLEDISKLKYKERLEKTFYHDILNKAGSIFNLSDLMISEGFSDHKELGNLIHATSKELVDEIKFHRNISNAEKNELLLEFWEFDLHGMIRVIAQQYEAQWQNKGIKINVNSNKLIQKLYSDEVIINRVLTNMVKNAAEACNQNDVIIIDIKTKNELYAISINNPGVIPEAVQSQIFQRSFSTKGAGRGIGTYSIKLFTEKYLNGKAYFTSNKYTGTTFTIEIPVNK